MSTPETNHDRAETVEDRSGAVAGIPVAEERPRIGTRRIETPVRVSTSVRERHETLDVPVFEEQVDVERVAVNRVVDAPATVRQEGDVTIIPLHEEVLVVEKKILLREEVRIIRRRRESREHRTVTLRTEEVHVERGHPRPAAERGGPGTDPPPDQAL